MAQQSASSACWWVPARQKLDLEWQTVCARAQQQLAKIADCVQKTTYVHSLSLACLLSRCRCTQAHGVRLSWSCASYSLRRLLLSLRLFGSLCLCLCLCRYLDGEHWGPLSDCDNLHERASSRVRRPSCPNAQLRCCERHPLTHTALVCYRSYGTSPTDAANGCSTTSMSSYVAVALANALFV